MANNRSHKFQQVRLRVGSPGAIVTETTELEKEYSRVKGIAISFPQESAQLGATFGLTIGGIEVFPKDYEAKMLTSNNSVSPNEKYFKVPWLIEAKGAKLEIILADGGNNPYLQAQSTGYVNLSPVNPLVIVYPYDVILKLWLTNDPL